MPLQSLAVFVSSRLELLQAGALASRLERLGLRVAVIAAESTPELAAEAGKAAGRGWARSLHPAAVHCGSPAEPGWLERLLFEQPPSEMLLPGALENPAGPVSLCGRTARRIAVRTAALWPEDAAALLSEGLADVLGRQQEMAHETGDYILAEFSSYGVWSWPTARGRLAELIAALEVAHEIPVESCWRNAAPAGVAEWVRLAAGARLILTDRTDVQIAACLLGRPCVSLRERTVVPETVRAGANLLAGATPEEIDRAVGIMLRKVAPWDSPWPQVALVNN